ncbi:MAG: DUF3467 domain-containing protein [Patescibacteria group bacterium]|nr:DUF3467 domain-containing protein [Patescibacteria group bacterium]
MPEPQNQPQQLQVNADAEILKGRYANALQISHAPEEFVLDFFLLHPPAGQQVARIITSPGHVKRIIAALTDNLKKYEAQFGEVKPADEPRREPMGFHK